MAEAAPERSRGAADTMASVVSVEAMPAPNPRTPTPTMIMMTPDTDAATATMPRPRVMNAPPKPMAWPRPSLASTREAARAARIPVTVAGISTSPAARGDRPRTSCRYWEKKYTRPTRANTEAAEPRTAPVNAGMRKSDRSSSGCSMLIWRLTKRTPETRPSTRPMARVVSNRPWAICLIA